MADKITETVIDIGGGKGEYFLGLAKANPDKNYIVLEPLNLPLDLKDKPENLHLLAWKTDVDSMLPFPEGSIDEVHINMLHRVLDTKNRQDFRDWWEDRNGNNYDSAFSSMDERIADEDYLNLLLDAKRVLKVGGSLLIIDIFSERIDPLIEKAGFKSWNREEIGDSNKTDFTKDFHYLSEWTIKK